MNSNNNNRIKEESGSVERSPLFEEEIRIRNILLSTSQQSSNSQGANLTKEQNNNSVLSTTSNSKKRKFCSINNEIETEQPLKKLFSVSSIASSASSNESSASSTTSGSSTSSASSSGKVHKIQRAKVSKVPEDAASLSSLPDYENCEDHEEYDENCIHCQKLEQLSREMANDRIILDELIGEGGFGTVYSGSFNNQWVAIKIFFDEDDIDDYDNEIKYIKMVEGHQSLVGCKFSKKYGKIGVIVFELMDQSLMSFIFENPGFFRDVNNRDKLVNIVKGIAKGIEALHDKNIVHVDLHPGNVLLDTAKFDAKLTDFGLSKIEDEEDEIMGNCCDEYSPPEAKDNGRPDHKKHSDIYQFGLMLLNIIVSRDPNVHTLIGIPASYVGLLMKCLDSSPAQRPSIKEIINIINMW